MAPPVQDFMDARLYVSPVQIWDDLREDDFKHLLVDDFKGMLVHQSKRNGPRNDLRYSVHGESRVQQTNGQFQSTKQLFYGRVGRLIFEDDVQKAK